MERTRIPAHHHAAERDKARRIGRGHGERVGHAGDALPMHGMAKDRRQAWLELTRRIGVERAVGNAELLRERQFALARVKGALAAIELEPALLAQKTGGARVCK